MALGPSVALKEHTASRWTTFDERLVDIAGLTTSQADALDQLTLATRERITERFAQVAEIKFPAPNVRSFRVALNQTAADELQREYIEQVARIGLNDQQIASVMERTQSLVWAFGKCPMVFEFVGNTPTFEASDTIHWHEVTDDWSRGTVVQSEGWGSREDFLRWYGALAHRAFE